MSTIFFAVFIAATAVGRFLGNFLVDRSGRLPILQASGLTATVSVAGVVFADSALIAGVGCVVWGLGVSLGFPVALSAVGETGEDAAARVSFASTVGYIAFLVGPPGLGLLGEHFGLRKAMVVVLVVTAASVTASRAAAGDRARVSEP